MTSSIMTQKSSGCEHRQGRGGHAVRRRNAAILANTNYWDIKKSKQTQTLCDIVVVTKHLDS